MYDFTSLLNKHECTDAAAAADDDDVDDDDDYWWLPVIELWLAAGLPWQLRTSVPALSLHSNTSLRCC